MRKFRIKTLDDAKKELRNQKKAHETWGKRLDKVEHRLDYLERKPLLTELCGLTGQPRSEYANLSIEELEKGVEVAKATVKTVDEKHKKERRQIQDDISFRGS